MGCKQEKVVNGTVLSQIRAQHARWHSRQCPHWYQQTLPQCFSSCTLYFHLRTLDLALQLLNVYNTQLSREVGRPLDEIQATRHQALQAIGSIDSVNLWEERRRGNNVRPEIHHIHQIKVVAIGKGKAAWRSETAGQVVAR